jgi:drug/metabolite transporter (DMT)-like permease
VLLRSVPIAALDVTVVANLVGGFVLLAAAWRGGARGWRGWPAGDWLRLAVASLTIYAAGFLLFYEAIDLIGASKTALLGRLEVLFIVGLAVLFLRERWQPRHWLASGLALMGAALVNLDAEALNLRVGLGEVLTIASAFLFAAGIVVLKSLVDRQDGQIVTGYGLLLGALLLLPVALWQGTAAASAEQVGAVVAVALLVRGLFLGLSWVTYNVAMRHIGASPAAVLFLSVVVFTVVLQLLVDAVAPQLGLRVPDNLGAALAGGVLIGIAVILIHHDAPADG